MVSIDFQQLHELADGVHKIERALGDEKAIRPREECIRSWAFRSIVSVMDMKAGSVIRPEMIWSKRPGTGIPSYKMDEVIGKKAKRDIKANTLLSWNDFE